MGGGIMFQERIMKNFPELIEDSDSQNYNKF